MKACKDKNNYKEIIKELRPFGYVYIIYNDINSKKYIGITTRSIDERYKEHTKADSYIGKAIRKYGEAHFRIKEIDTGESLEELYNLEKEYIKKYDSFHNGYNLTIGGDGIQISEPINYIYTKKQKKFLQKVNVWVDESLKEKDYISFTSLKLAEFYLTVMKPRDKKLVAKTILHCKDRMKIAKLADVTMAEIIYYYKIPLANFKEYKEW